MHQNQITFALDPWCCNVLSTLPATDLVHLDCFIPNLLITYPWERFMGHLTTWTNDRQFPHRSRVSKSLINPHLFTIPKILDFIGRLQDIFVHPPRLLIPHCQEIYTMCGRTHQKGKLFPNW